jgi:DNA-binding LacI/PurR family transcriptional regulator
MGDVARLSGVSQTTVSFVINDVPNANISEKTRAAVLKAVKELG